MSATRRLRVHLSRRTERFILAREGGREEAWRSAGGSVSQTQATSNLNADDGPPALPREFPLRPSTPYLGPKIWIILCFFLVRLSSRHRRRVSRTEQAAAITNFTCMIARHSRGARTTGPATAPRPRFRRPPRTPDGFAFRRSR